MSEQPSRQPPGDLAMWFFICAELLVFGAFFVSYAFARSRHVELFNESQLTLNRVAGLINTAVLITGSYFVVRAVTAIREQNSRACSGWLWAATGSGLLFVIIKISEFAEKLSAGITLSSNTFYMFYLSLTFFHFLHVILGMVILVAVALKAQRGGYSRDDYSGVETGASYWHMVDLVWIVLFPLVYVLH